MLIELYIFFELITVVLFGLSFFTKQEILWALTCLFSGVMAFLSTNIEKSMYVYNSTITAYSGVTVTYTYTYLMGLNIGLFSLAMLLLIFDIWEKYGSKL